MRDRLARVAERPRLSPRFAGVLLALLVLGVGVERYARTVDRLYPHDVIDDAYITYRYAENWAAGHGPTWNPGEEPVEGYSAPLWMAILAAGDALGAHVPTLSKKLCLLFAILTLVTLGLFLWRARAGPAWALVAVGALAAMPTLAVWSVGGMETSLFAWLLLASAWAVLEAGRAPRSRTAWVVTAALLSLIGLTRTEGPLVVAAFVAALWIATTDATTRRRTLYAAGTASATIVAHLVTRRLYYGRWLPLPAEAKREAFVGQPLFDEFFLEHWVYFALAAVAVVLIREGHRRAALRHALAVITLLSLIVLNVEPWMGFHDRYLFPVVPLLLFAAALGASEALKRAREPVLAVLLVSAVLVMQGEHLLGGARADTVGKVERYSTRLQRSHVAPALWLRDNAPEDALLAVADAGVIPYYSRLTAIDMYGLNDAHVAEHGLSADYVLSQDPDLIVLTSQSLHRPIRSHPRFREGYEQLREWDGLYPVTLHCRRDRCAELRPEPDTAHQAALESISDVVVLRAQGTGGCGTLQMGSKAQVKCRSADASSTMR